MHDSEIINSSNIIEEDDDFENGCIVKDVDGTSVHPDAKTEPAAAMDKPQAKEYTTMETLLLAYQSLGVVYGDLVTSPVNIFSATTLTNLSEEDLLGIFSLIFWTLTIVVWIKYVFIVLDANDNGEGGTFALYSYLRQHIHFDDKFIIQRRKLGCDDQGVKCNKSEKTTSPLNLKIRKFLETNIKAQNFLEFIVLVGTCMVIGDGALTPATCVLPAIQGIQSCSSKITQGHVVIISVVILIALFLLQRCGTSKVSFVFTPIMLVWLATNACIGIYNTCKYYPSLFKAVSPHYIVLFISRDAKTSWTILGAVFLGITGAEAMFADLGHFNKKAIQWSYSFIVHPSIIVTYAGETAYLIKNPQNITNAYYSSLPSTVYWPMFVVSTLAAIVASQSMISASFSIVKQSQALGCFPRVTVLHTSSTHEGQVYCPEINYVLMILCIGLVIGFKGGTALANAYGVVVIWVMIITTLLTTLVMLVIWDTHILLVLCFFVPYILIEGIFTTSLLNKIPQGGWVPFAISAILGAVMLSWTYGRSKQSMYEAQAKISLIELNQMISSSKIYRTPGICFFFTDLVNGIPPIISHYIQHTNCIREIMVIVNVTTLPIATVLPDEKFEVEKLGVEGVYRCLVQLGFRDSLNMEENDHITAMVAEIGEHSDTIIGPKCVQSSEAAEKEAVFAVGMITLRAKQKNGWLTRFIIDHVYGVLEKNCRSSVPKLHIPPEKTMQVGMVYEV